MIFKDLSRKIYKRICYSFTSKDILYVGISPKGRDKDTINFLENHNLLTTMDCNLLRAKLGAKKHYVGSITEALCFKDKSFDAVIMLGVLGYGLDSQKDIEKAFKNLKRILRPRGKVYFELTKELS